MVSELTLELKWKRYAISNVIGSQYFLEIDLGFNTRDYAKGMMRADLIGKWSVVNAIWNPKVNRISEEMGEHILMWPAKEWLWLAIKRILGNYAELVLKRKKGMSMHAHMYYLFQTILKGLKWW